MLHPGLSETEPSGATVLAITSGKGGVGKTNIAANLAICLAGLHQRVVLMDADLGLGNLDVVLNIQSRHHLAHVISGHRELEQIIHIGPLGVEVICGGSGIEMLANMNTFQRQRLLDGLDALHRRADFLIIDTGAGIQSNVVSFCPPRSDPRRDHAGTDGNDRRLCNDQGAGRKWICRTHQYRGEYGALCQRRTVNIPSDSRCCGSVSELPRL